MINLFENEKVTKEDFLNVIKDKNVIGGAVYGILNHNKEINDFCIRKRQQFPFIFKTKFNVFIFIIKDLSFKKCCCGNYLNFNQLLANKEFCSKSCAMKSKKVRDKVKQTYLEKYRC